MTTEEPCWASVVVAGHLRGSRLWLSTQYHDTVTPEMYQPFFPTVPEVMVGVADGVVTAIALKHPAV